MIKQPKYFVSKPKGQTAIEESPAPIALQAVAPTPKRLQLPRIALPKSTKIAHFAVLGVGLSTLCGLSLLVAVTSGLIHASTFKDNLPQLFPKAPEGVIVAGSAGTGGQGLSFDIKTADARVEIVRSFLDRYNSPLTPQDHYAQELVASADRYGLDYRLLPAIMMQESNLCKASDPKLHNCLGFGIHANGTLGFDTYEEGFDRAAKELKANYIDQGLVTPEQIMKKYTPSSNGSWANSVNQWIAEMEHNDREVGKTATADANLLEYVVKR
ncbi:MAG: hypothetical protein ABI758_05520 [Candidatus Woesebacteria bacterium]